MLSIFEFLYANEMTQNWTPHCVVSLMGHLCLAVSLKKDTRLITTVDK